MKTQRTHLLALRAASQVTAVSRAFRRVAVGTAASAVLVSGVGGCATDSAPGAVVDVVSDDSGVSDRADVSSLLDTILGNDSESAVADTRTGIDLGSADGVDGTDGTDVSDVVSIVDVVGSDLSDGNDTTDSVDVADAMNPEDVVSVGDASVSNDMAASDDTGDTDVGSSLPETCLIPNGEACITSEDCLDEMQSWGVECIEAECHDSDLTSEEAQACCQAQYAAGNFRVAGCNPWGPPAPPADRGYRLSDLADAIGVA